MQAEMHLLLTPIVGATAQPAAPKAHGNGSDLEAPKLEVSHYVGVAMGAE